MTTAVFNTDELMGFSVGLLPLPANHINLLLLLSQRADIDIPFSSALKSRCDIITTKASRVLLHLSPLT